jgi:hypothetical protein
MTKQEKPLYTLIPLEDFKALLGVDDREDKQARFCLVTSTLTIEQYCKRRFLRKKYIERRPYLEDLFIPLNEYPVSKVVSVYRWSKDEILEPEFYEVVPACGTDLDVPTYISFSPSLRRRRSYITVKVDYWAGYAPNKIPADLMAACLELASWNLNRYRGRRVGMTGNIRGSGKDGEHFEMSMPENVRSLLEPYRRKTI